MATDERIDDGTGGSGRANGSDGTDELTGCARTTRGYEPVSTMSELAVRLASGAEGT